MDYQFTVRVHVEDPAELQREITAHNELVERGITSGIISDRPEEWNWDDLSLVYNEEMAGKDAFEVTAGEEVVG